MTKKMICPLCKMVIDEDTTYAAYRKTTEYKQGEYPEWAYADGVNDSIASHLLNFHRLPEKITALFATGMALGKFTKDHPEYEFGLVMPKTEETKP